MARLAMDPAAPTSLLRSFERHLRAENRSDQTVATYLIGARQAEAFLADRGTSVAAASRADLEAFLGDPLAGRTASTAATYYKVLRILYRWLEEEDEITANPHGQDAAADRARPAGPGRPRRRAAAAVRRCAGKRFEDRRDTALLILLLDTGARRAELTGLLLADVDLELDVLLVLGKGRRERALPFGNKAAAALDRYLRIRARHKHASLPWLWLGQQGRLTAQGLVMMLRRRGAQAGLPGLHPHQFRHTGSAAGGDGGPHRGPAVRGE